MSLLPDPPKPIRHELKKVADPTATAGTRYLYRGVTIHGAPKDTMFSFTLPGLPMGKDGHVGGLGDVGEPVRIIDAFLDTGRLPPPYVMPGEKRRS